MTPRRFEAWIVRLDPTVASEIQKTRPCVVVSPDEMNGRIRTVIVAPLTSASKAYPTRVATRLDGRDGQIALDRIRTVDRARLLKRVGVLTEAEATACLRVLGAMFSA